MKHPVKVSLKKGEAYLFCTCGNSADKVLCDGSHKGTSFTPTEFLATRTWEQYLCVCKESQNGIYCDGTHARHEKMVFDFEV